MTNFKKHQMNFELIKANFKFANRYFKSGSTIVVCAFLKWLQFITKSYPRGVQQRFKNWIFFHTCTIVPCWELLGLLQEPVSIATKPLLWSSSLNYWRRCRTCQGCRHSLRLSLAAEHDRLPQSSQLLAQRIPGFSSGIQGDL